MRDDFSGGRAASTSAVGTIELVADFLPQREASEMYSLLHAEIPWEQHRITLFGKTQPVPRLSCWIGDSGTDYVYSGNRFEPRAWTPTLNNLRRQLEQLIGSPFNSVLANLYRSGADGMGWHADDEPELGPQPTIASISLGGARRFLLRERAHEHRADARRKSELLLGHGSLLIMRGDSQIRFQHSVPKTAKAVPPRINLTFRQIAAAAKPAGSQTGAGKYE